MKGEGAFMKFRTFAVVCVFLACASIGNAELVRDITVDSASIQNSEVIWAGGDADNYTMIITGDQSQSPGIVSGSFSQETADDPTVKVINSVNNDTGLNWTGYHVTVSMDRTFTISSALPSIPGDWIASITQQPVLVGSDWVGQLDFSAGTPVADGDTLEFSYKITFGGSTHYKYDQDMIPVPEPGSIVLLVGGLLGLLAVRRRFA
jgi:hypothetical protein